MVTQVSTLEPKENYLQRGAKTLHISKFRVFKNTIPKKRKSSGKLNIGFKVSQSKLTYDSRIFTEDLFR